MKIEPKDLQQKKGLPEEAVVEYLQQHHDFFIHHEDLLATMKFSHLSGKAESLVELKRVLLHKENQQLLRDRQQLQEQMKEFIAIAQKNTQLNQRIQSLVITLSGVTGVDEFFQSLYSSLCNEFNTDTVVLRWFELPSPSIAKRMEFVEYDAQVFTLFEELLESNQPRCGQIPTEQIEYLFPNSKIASAVLIPLGIPKPQGLLAMGSQDAARFSADMGVHFLKYLGVLVSYLLKMWLR